MPVLSLARRGGWASFSQAWGLKDVSGPGGGTVTERAGRPVVPKPLTMTEKRTSQLEAVILNSMCCFGWAIVPIHVLVAQMCLTLCDLTDCGPPGSSVHGILQARTLEWQ
ncbi:unnamed protein product [Rangifer tarandus platyrhynchus]|uniref:Uncharacterized protein n=2 Tax=Rangifer tarandus platyrhynchus TaxID=3082113 RepID=A0ABN8Z5J0_RANTA|nr:unnamed protein product [Rangifer tarandus platyrhynchus]